jgi:hypothetical protein
VTTPWLQRTRKAAKNDATQLCDISSATEGVQATVLSQKTSSTEGVQATILSQKTSSTEGV